MFTIFCGSVTIVAPHDGDYLALQKFDNNIKINVYMHIHTITYDVVMFAASSSDTESAVVPVGNKSSETDGKEAAVVTVGDRLSETDGKRLLLLLLETD